MQTGDPIGPGAEGSDGGSCVWKLLDPSISTKTFAPEFHKKLKHISRGTVSMATIQSDTNSDVRLAASQFVITLGEKLDHLDGKAAVFGHVVEGFDVLEKINTAFVDQSYRPLRDIRIRHTKILDENDIPDPPGLREPPESPAPTPAQLATVRIADDEVIDMNADPEEAEKLRREREARAQALTLEMVGDLPFAEVVPPENVLFVCKLNPVTDDEDLKLIFGRFGTILSCEVIREKRTGDSLQYAFVEYEKKEECERAYYKMRDVLIDDHRIHVDFSQSVSRMSREWRAVIGETRVNKEKKRRSRVSFGGIEGLEKRRQYAAEPDPVEEKYDMVFDEEELAGRASKVDHAKRDLDRAPRRHRSRSRSPRRYRYHDPDRYDRRRDNRRSPSRERHHRDGRPRSSKGHHDGGRDRDRLYRHR